MHALACRHQPITVFLHDFALFYFKMLTESVIKVSLCHVYVITSVDSFAYKLPASSAWCTCSQYTIEAFREYTLEMSKVVSCQLKQNCSFNSNHQLNSNELSFFEVKERRPTPPPLLALRIWFKSVIT